MGLFADAFGEDAILIKASVDNRSAAIELAGELLVASGKANKAYIASMLGAVEKFGPYIVIAPGIALAHGKPGDGVIETGLSLLMLESPIEFQHSQNDPVQLVFGLAATDHESHIELMAELAQFLSDQDSVNSLLTCSDTSQIRVLLGTIAK
jgi:PTS system ascorbate-specific IIA component